MPQTDGPAKRLFKGTDTKGHDMRRFKTKVITDESQVPDGFKRICSLASSLTDQKKLSDAHTDGFIDAVKLMRSTDDRTGPVWVDADAAIRVLASSSGYHAAKAGVAKQPDGNGNDPALVALIRIDNGLALIHATLERLANAVESIATQPKKDEFSEFVSH